VPPKRRPARGIASKLLLTPGGNGEDPTNIRLVWRVHQQNENEGLFSDLDAATGALLFTQPRSLE